MLAVWIIPRNLYEVKINKIQASVVGISQLQTGRYNPPLVAFVFYIHDMQGVYRLLRDNRNYIDTRL